MKNTITILLLTALFAGCKKEPSKGYLTFWQKNWTGSPDLYVDGKMKGALKQTFSEPECKSSTPGKVITIELPFGEHKFSLNNGSAPIVEYYISVETECKTIKIE